MAETFNQYFISIDKNLQKSIPPAKRPFPDYLKDRYQNSFFIQPIIAEEVKDIIMTLIGSKSTGPNSIPTIFLKKSIDNWLTKLINKSFEARIFPDTYKVAKAVPILKSETSLLCNSCRPISLLLNIGKVMEKLMHQRLNFFLEQCNCSYSFQFGFKLNYSANSALMSIVQNAQMQLNNREFAACIFVELGKAFGTADCRILLQKLEHYGVRGISKKWFRSYLTTPY